MTMKGSLLRGDDDVDRFLAASCKLIPLGLAKSLIELSQLSDTYLTLSTAFLTN